MGRIAARSRVLRLAVVIGLVPGAADSSCLVPLSAIAAALNYYFAFAPPRGSVGLAIVRAYGLLSEARVAVRR